jgi:hypothetical protein
MMGDRDASGGPTTTTTTNIDSHKLLPFSSNIDTTECSKDSEKAKYLYMVCACSLVGAEGKVFITHTPERNFLSHPFFSSDIAEVLRVEINKCLTIRQNNLEKFSDFSHFRFGKFCLAAKYLSTTTCRRMI